MNGPKVYKNKKFSYGINNILPTGTTVRPLENRRSLFIL